MSTDKRYRITLTNEVYLYTYSFERSTSKIMNFVLVFHSLRKLFLKLFRTGSLKLKYFINLSL